MYSRVSRELEEEDEDEDVILLGVWGIELLIVRFTRRVSV